MMIAETCREPNRTRKLALQRLHDLVGNGAMADERKLFGMIDSLRRIVLSPPTRSERFHALFLNHGRSVIGQTSLGLGNVCGVHLRLRELFTHALRVGADSMILAHNHPSGDCRPSLCDVEATTRVAHLAKALEIELIDHLIFTQNAVFSMRGGSKL